VPVLSALYNALCLSIHSFTEQLTFFAVSIFTLLQYTFYKGNICLLLLVAGNIDENISKEGKSTVKINYPYPSFHMR